MSAWERTKQGVSGTHQAADNHIDQVWQDTNDKARQDRDQMTAGENTPQDLNVAGRLAYQVNGVFSSTTIVPNAVLNLIRADQAYNNHAPDTLKQAVSNIAEAHNNWAQENPNSAQITQLGFNVATTFTGAKAGLAGKMGRGNDDFGSATTTHADDAFARAGDYDLGNVYEGNPNEPAVRRLQDKKLNDIGLGVRNPHYDTKHAYYTSLQEQYDRAMYGTNPQTGKSGNPVNASKFFNAPDMEYALNEAERLYTLDPAKYTDTRGNIVVDVHFNRPVGHGYMGDNDENKRLGIIGGEYRWTNTATVELGKVTKKPFTAYPNLSQGTAQSHPFITY